MINDKEIIIRKSLRFYHEIAVPSTGVPFLFQSEVICLGEENVKEKRFY